MWDFDYFVETHLKVVNLLIKMRILLSFICCNDDDLKYFLLYGYVCVIFSLMRILLSFTCCNDYFLINEFKCAWGSDGGFWQINWWCFSDIYEGKMLNFLCGMGICPFWPNE